MKLHNALRIAAALVVVLFVAAASASATELPANEPTHSDAELLQKLQQTQMPPRTEGFVHIPDQKERVLVQPMGRMFRDFHSIGQFWIDAALIVIAIAAMGGLYVFAGSMHYEPDPRGRTIQRFRAFERFIHWLVAFCFISLALTGLNLVFGRRLVQPWLGDNAFAEITQLGKLSHNFLAVPFTLGLVVMALQWLRPNIPDRNDIMWVKMAGGMFGGPHPVARKFNAGQKMIYWIAVGGGGLLVLSGAGLMLPFWFTNILGMQIVQVTHSLIAALMIAVIIGHIYLGTVGVRGSFSAMATGRVDLNWAREHHWLWVEEEVANGKVEPDALYPAE